MTLYDSPIRLFSSFLGDVSYYYSERPEYLGSNYTWPSLGPNYISSCSQSIPAHTRYFTGNKTYNPYPTTTITKSVTLPRNEIWSGTITCTDNVTVPAGSHSVTFNTLGEGGEPLPFGIYFYKLVAGEYQAVKQLVLIK